MLNKIFLSEINTGLHIASGFLFNPMSIYNSLGGEDLDAVIWYTIAIFMIYIW